MTSEDHTHDALFTVLRAPARPDELSGEADAVAAMVAALEPVPARHGSRSRRGLVLAAVTVASLGVGGLAAAGPGIFTAPFTGGSDRSRTDGESLSIGDDPTEQSGNDTNDGVPDSADDEGGKPNDAAPGTVVAPDNAGDRGRQSGTAQESPAGDDPSTDVECADGNHGATVSEVATSSTPGDRGAEVSDAARSDCGKPNADDTATDEDAPGRSDDAPGRSGDQPGVGNDGTPGPPASTPGQGKPPTNPGPPASTPGQGQPGNPGSDQGQPPTDPGPPASTPGNGNPGNGNPGNGNDNPGNGNPGNGDGDGDD